MANQTPLNTFLIRDTEGVGQDPSAGSQYPALLPQAPFLPADTFLTLPEQMEEAEGEGMTQGGLLYLDSASALHVFVHHLPQPSQPTAQLVEEEEDSQQQFVVVGALKNGDLPPSSPPTTCHVSVDSILEEDLDDGGRGGIYLPQPPNPTPAPQTLPPAPVLTLVGDGGSADAGDTSNITLDSVPHITLEEIIQKFASSPDSPVDQSPNTITTITRPPDPPLPEPSKVRVKLLESREGSGVSGEPGDDGCLYDVLVTFRCRVCGEVYEEKEQLLQHHSQFHKQTQGGVVKIRVTTSNTSTTASATTTTSTTRFSPPRLDKEQRDVSIHSCTFCSLDFQTLRECQEHIIKDHDIKAKEGTTRHYRPHGAPVKYPTQPGLLIGHRKTQTLPQVEGMDVDGDDGVEGKRKVKTPHSLQDQFWLQKQRPKPVCLVEVEKTHRCSVSPCKYKFSSEANLQFHQECHGGGEGEDRGFTCPHCSSRYDKWSVCQLHLWKEHGVDIDLLTCGICHTYKTCTQQRLLIHQKIHSDLREHVCKTCGKDFKQLAQLLNHQVCHITDPKDFPPWAGEKYCEECQKWFKDRKTLRAHISLIHLKRKPHSCPDCPYRSSRKYELTVHMRQHTGKRPHKCPLCGWQARDHNAMRRHKLGHQDIKPFRCPAPLCQFGSRNSFSFKRHMARQHPNNEALYRCQFCPLETAYLQEYITHSMKHEKILLEQTMKRCLQDNAEAQRTQGGDGNKVDVEGTTAPPPTNTNITALQNLDINQKMEFITIKFDDRSFHHTKEDGKVSTAGGGGVMEAVSLPQVVVNNGHYIIGLPPELSPMREGDAECHMNAQTTQDLKLKPPNVTTINHISPQHYSSSPTIITSSQPQNTSPHDCNTTIT